MTGSQQAIRLLLVLVILGLGAWFIEDVQAQSYTLDCLPELTLLPVGNAAQGKINKAKFTETEAAFVLKPGALSQTRIG